MQRTRLALLACLAGCQHAPPRPASAPATPPACLAATQIDHTTIQDDSTILFTMRNHAVYRNRLDAPCFGLAFDPGGFTYEPTDPGADLLCSNLVLIRLSTKRSVCALGPFVMITPPAPR